MRFALFASRFVLRGCLAGLIGAAPLSRAAADRISVARDIPYLEAGRAEKLDLYLPATAPGDGPVPAVVWVHGGGYSGGDKAGGREFGETLAGAGYVCASINYAGGPGSWPMSLYDCKNAVRFLRSHAAQYGIDPDRIGIFGASSGAHFALLAGLTAGRADLEPTAPYPGVSSAVRCIGDFYGPADLLTVQRVDRSGKPAGPFDLSIFAPIFTVRRTADAALWRAVSPMTYLSPASPPVLIAQGRADADLDYHQGAEMDSALTAVGVAHEFLLLDGVGHNFGLTSVPDHPLPRDLRSLVLAFLRDHLGAAPHGTPVMTFPATPRVTVNLDQGWRFFPRDNIHGPEPAFNDAEWEAVDLPHTWNAQDGADGGNDYYRGSAWYRRHFVPDPKLAGKRLYLQFDGVSLMADVSVNGVHIGNHQGGFGRFRFDVTDLLHPGKDNVIAVRADNGRIGIIPIAADFTFFGGIYRSVSLVATDQIQISTMDYASSGVFVTQDSVSAERADLTVRAEIESYEEKAQTIEVDTQLRGRQNEVIQTAALKIHLAPGDAFEATQPLSLIHPHLWDGRADPYLYTVSVVVRVGGTVRDAVTVPLGLRFFRVDPAAGFFLNGHPLDLHGVNRHQDRLGKGWAISAADEAEDFSILQELGASAIRVSHYQQAETWYERLDQAGIVAWAEVPFVGNALPNKEFLANAKLQLRELIRQNYNHPAICFWGVGNETRDPPANNVIVALASEAKAEDATRLTTYASDAKPDDIRNWNTDVVAFNHYAGWYAGDYDTLPGWLDALHAGHPKSAVGLSEYGAGASIAQHDDGTKRPLPASPWHPEEYQARLHEASWLALAQRPFIWGKFIWCLFDFASDARHEGDHAGRNDKGLVTYDRQTRKDAFYWYRSNWNPSPLVYLTDRRFTERVDPVTEIKVYATAPEVDLTLNGQSLGTQQSADHRFRWPGVKLAPGVNRVTATAHFGDLAITDACTWVLKPASPGSAPPPPTEKRD